jgi:metal-responsive CopG/Arc/MetJ family transcriptional regulator
MRTTKVQSVSFPPELLRDAERLAEREGRTKSEFFREAVRRYIQERRWTGLRAYGAAQARRLRLKESDVERVIAEYRKAR